jgi:hypothetical protein
MAWFSPGKQTLPKIRLQLQCAIHFLCDKKLIDFLYLPANRIKRGIEHHIKVIDKTMLFSALFMRF